jgi:hypothetical protein
MWKLLHPSSNARLSSDCPSPCESEETSGAVH